MSKDAFAGIPPVGTLGMAASPSLLAPEIGLGSQVELPAPGSVRREPAGRPSEPAWARLLEAAEAEPWLGRRREGTEAEPEPARLGRLLTSCVECGRLHAPAHPLALHPVCRDCAG